MSVIAVYNMEGGVGKTTTAINLSYLCAAAGQRTLLWDLDPQAASSFAFRIRPHVPGFRKRRWSNGDVFAEAIKQTDYDGLDLLPAISRYRKLDRLLGRLGNPERVMSGLLGDLARGYDVVVLDCPPGMSLLTEGVFAAADIVLVPHNTHGSFAAHPRATDCLDRTRRSHPGRRRRSSAWSIAARRCTSEPATGPSAFRSCSSPGRSGHSSLVEQMAVRRGAPARLRA